MSQSTISFYKFVHKNPVWVDIPAMFKYIKNQPKGFIFKTLADIIREINGEWVFTYNRNADKQYQNMFEMLKTMNLKHDMPHLTRFMHNEKYKRNAGCGQHSKAQVQALEDFFHFPSRVTHLLAQATAAVGEVRETVAHVDYTAERVNENIDTVQEMLVTVRTIVQGFQDQINELKENMGDTVMTMLLYLAKIVSVCFLLSKKENQDATSIAALITLILPSSITSGIQAFASGLIRVIQGMTGAVAQADDQETDGFIKSFFSLTVGIVKGLFRDVPKDAFENMNLSSKKVRLIADYIRGCTTIVDFVVKIYEKCIELIGDRVLKYFGIIPWFMKEDSIQPLIDEFLDIKQTKLDQQASIHKEAARKVCGLYDRLILVEAKMNKKIHKSGGQFKIMPYLRIMIRSLENTVNRIPDHLRNGLVPRRTKPFWVYIYGDPRIGKSAVFQPYVVNALSKALNLNTSYEDYTNYTYLRNCGEDFWEGYDNHSVLWYNDIFQNYSDEQAMNKAVMELTNVVDDNVYPLEMAFERKHGVYFNSEVVISNAQDEIIGAPFLTNKCWSGGAHLYARRNVSVKIEVNPRYKVQNAVGYDQARVDAKMLMNPNECVGYEHCNLFTAVEFKQKLLFPNDMYTLTFTDRMSGLPYLSTNFVDGVKYICDEAISFKATQGEFKNRLYNHFEAMWGAAPTIGQAQADDGITVEDVLEDEDVPPIHPMPQATYQSSRPTPAMGEYQDATDDAQDPGYYRGLWLDGIYARALRDVEATFPELLGTNNYSTISRARTRDDGYRTEAVYVYYANNCDLPDGDVHVRVTLAIEVLGADFWRRVPLPNSKWQKMCLSFKYCMQSFRNQCRFLIATMPAIVTFVGVCVSAYMWYRVIKFYFNVMYKFYGLSTKEVSKPIEEEQDKCIAETAEGKQKKGVHQILRVKRQPVQATAQSYDSQNSVIENILHDHMCKFSIQVVDKDGVVATSRMFGSGVCVGSDIFVIPHHFWYRWMEMKELYNSKSMDLQLILHWNDKIQNVVAWDMIDSLHLDYDHTIDLIFIRIRNVVQKSHIKKFFVNSDDRPNMFELYLYGLKSQSFNMATVSVTQGNYVTTMYEHKSQPDPLFGKEFITRELNIPRCIQYWSCFTTVGDCGMLVMNCDSKLNCRKISGMHTAGHTAMNYGIGSMIFREDIEEAFEHFYPDKDYVRSIAQEYGKPDEERAKVLTEMGLVVLGQIPRLVVPEFNVNRIPMLTLPRSTKISKSVVYEIMNEDYGASTVAPARLRPFVNENGVRVSPLMNGMKKLVKFSPVIPNYYAEPIKQHMYESIKGWKSSYKPRILTNYETINGVGVLNPVEMKTSAGYPYVFLNNTAGKHPFFKQLTDNPKTFEMGSFVASQFQIREDMARKGLISETYFMDTLKDETRELEKVALGKTRLFQIAPMDLNFLIRKYFGMFIAHFHTTFIDGEGAIGVNANSYDWTLMIQRQLEMGDSFINGDGVNYDASAGQANSMHQVDVINAWYNGSYEEDLARKTIYATFLNSKHIHGDVVYIMLQGNKSGIALTTIFNILTGMFAIRLTYMRAGYHLHTFHENVRPKFYGDDENTAVNSVRVPKVTCLLHKQSMAMLGIDYTSADKSEIIDGWYKLNEVSFLKRKFVFDGMKYLPCLDYRVVMEIARWSESDPSLMEDQMNRFNSCLLEISNYGKNKFQQIRERYVEYCFLIMESGLNINAQALFSYDYCEHIKYGERCDSKDFLIQRVDLASNVDKFEVVLHEGGVGHVKLSNLETLNSSNVSLYERTATAQTYEGKSKPKIIQIIRPPKASAQGEEESLLPRSEEEIDFDCHMIMVEYLRELQPCMEAFSKAVRRTYHKRSARHGLSILNHKVQAMITIFHECRKLIVGSSESAIAQGEESISAGPVKETTETGPDGVQENAVVSQMITTFVDANVPHQPPQLHTSIPYPNNSNLSIDLDTYFARPIILDSFSWVSTSAIWTKVWDQSFPRMLTANGLIKQKLSLMQFYRPDIEFTIMCNATKFHYGRLVFAVLPLRTFNTISYNDCYNSPYNIFTTPHWYQVSAGTQQSIRFVVPYRHLASQVTIHADSPWERNLFDIVGYVSVPLQTAGKASAASGMGPADVSISARFVKTRFAGYNFLDAASTQGEESTKNSMAGITNFNPIGIVSERVVSTTLTGMSNVVKDMSHLAYAAGFSVPVNKSTTNSMQIRQPLFNKIEDTPNTVVLGPSSNARVVPGREYVNSEEDDMNINNIIGHNSLLNTVAMTSSNAAGAVLFTMGLVPRNFRFGGVGYTNNTTSFYPLPVCYLAHMFDYWRGSFKFHFSVVASAFHSCRIRIFYIPANAGGSPTLPTDNVAGLTQSSHVRNIIWDINKTADITVEVPFDSYAHWLRCDIKQNVSGVIGLQVINPLTSADPSGVVSPINIQVFASCCEDFQFSKPAARVGMVWAPDFASTQGEEMDACVIPSSSSMCLREQKGFLLGDVDAKCRKFHDNMSTPFTSVKQLVNQLTPFDRAVYTDTDKSVINGFSYTPYGYHIRGWNDTYWNAPLHIIQALYNFQRGSFRFHSICNNKIQACAYIKGSNNSTSYGVNIFDPVNGVGTEVPSSLESLNSTQYGFSYFYDNTVYPVDVTVPYDNIYPCAKIPNGNLAFPPPDVNVLYTSYSTQKTKGVVIINCVAAGDDFMLGYRRPVPRIRIATKPVLLLRSGIEEQGMGPVLERPTDLGVNIVVGNVNATPDEIRDILGKNAKAFGLVYRCDGVRWHPIVSDTVDFEYKNNIWMTKDNVKANASQVKFLLVLSWKKKGKRSLVEKFLNEPDNENDSTESDLSD